LAAVPEQVVVVGLGEVGLPLLELVQTRFDAVAVDLAPPAATANQTSVLHVCYPFEIDDFVGETERYIGVFEPCLTIINSTVAVGTTRAVHERTGAAIVNSPVRGKHSRMLEDLQAYTKFVGGIDQASASQACEHFESLGLRTHALSAPEATEIAKLTETTYFGLMIAWAQEVERYCDREGQNYDEVVSFYEEIPFFPPVKYFPGVIGGHCVMPNVEILRQLEGSPLLDVIEWSNMQKIERDSAPSPSRRRTAGADRPNG
jgi:UDP-N-acetyl-D-mannosaminuronate dehydrogenase